MSSSLGMMESSSTSSLRDRGHGGQAGSPPVPKLSPAGSPRDERPCPHVVVTACRWLSLVTQALQGPRHAGDIQRDRARCDVSPSRHLPSREGLSPVLDQGDHLRVGFPDDALPVHLDQPVTCRARGEDSVTTGVWWHLDVPTATQGRV